MNIFLYDHTFEGLLTSVFEAYSRRTFPDALLWKESRFLCSTTGCLPW